MAIPLYCDDLSVKICRALGIDPNMTRRVILDVQIGNAVKAYVEMFGSNELLSIEWDMALGGAKITKAKTE